MSIVLGWGKEKKIFIVSMAGAQYKFWQWVLKGQILGLLKTDYFQFFKINV